VFDYVAGWEGGEVGVYLDCCEMASLSNSIVYLIDYERRRYIYKINPRVVFAFTVTLTYRTCIECVSIAMG
jgi:hypothetical protein